MKEWKKNVFSSGQYITNAIINYISPPKHKHFILTRKYELFSTYFKRKTNGYFIMNSQMQRTELEKMTIRGRKWRKKVRGNKQGQAFAGRKKKRRRLNWAGAATQLEHTCPCSAVAQSLNGELHGLSLSSENVFSAAGGKILATDKPEGGKWA